MARILTHVLGHDIETHFWLYAWDARGLHILSFVQLQAALQPLFWTGGNEGGRGRMTAGYSARRGTGADKSEIMMVTESHLKSSSKSAANLSRNRLEICTVSDPITALGRKAVIGGKSAKSTRSNVLRVPGNSASYIDGHDYAGGEILRDGLRPQVARQYSSRQARGSKVGAHIVVELDPDAAPRCRCCVEQGGERGEKRVWYRGWRRLKRFIAAIGGGSRDTSGTLAAVERYSAAVERQSSVTLAVVVRYSSGTWRQSSALPHQYSPLGLTRLSQKLGEECDDFMESGNSRKAEVDEMEFRPECKWYCICWKLESIHSMVNEVGARARVVSLLLTAVLTYGTLGWTTSGTPERRRSRVVHCKDLGPTTRLECCRPLVDLRAVRYSLYQYASDLEARKVDENIEKLLQGSSTTSSDLTTDQEAAGSRLLQRIEVWSVKLSSSGAVLERYSAVVSGSERYPKRQSGAEAVIYPSPVQTPFRQETTL
ncbi:hypothetical protein B0H11DRAFT_2186769 [Mycena galericulata]|nr:hypothetical protein B0H11DRAFT_2186769 [Mycena galericulata]